MLVPLIVGFMVIASVMTLVAAPFWVPQAYAMVPWPWEMYRAGAKASALVLELLHQPGWQWATRHRFGSIFHSSGVYISLGGDTCRVYPDGNGTAELKTSYYWKNRIARKCTRRLVIEEKIDADLQTRRLATNIIAFAEKVRSVQP